MDSLGFFIYIIMLPACKDGCFSLCALVFFFLLYCLRPPVQCWIEVVRANIFSLFLILGEKVLFFTIACDVSCKLKKLYLFLFCWKFLSWMGVEHCQMPFLHLFRWSCDFFSFFHEYGIFYSLIFQMVSHPFIHWSFLDSLY